MIGLDTPIPVAVVLLWLIVGAAATIHGAFRLRRVTTVRQRAVLNGLRGLALVLTALVLLNPFVVRRQADPDQFQVVLLGDASASMTMRDLAGGEPRLAAVRKALLDADGLSADVGERWQTSTRIFAETQHPLSGDDFSVLPGRTALGDALQEAGDGRRDGNDAGAIVLLSDGNSNHGEPPETAARRLGEQGIPVNAVKIGAEGELHDVQVAFRQQSFTTEPGERVTLPVTVESNLPETSEVEVSLQEGESVLDRQQVEVGGDRRVALAQFEVQPFARGEHVYRAVIEPPAADSRPETDTDYATVEVKRPDRFQILYLGGHLGWQYPFLQRLCEDHRQLEMAAVLQTGKTTFFMKGELPEDAPANAFPESLSVYAEFDVVIADTQVFAELPSAAIEALRGFVNRRGGGLLAIGPAAGVPETLTGILPAASTTEQRAAARTHLQVDNPDVLQAEGGSALTVPPGPWIPEGSRLLSLKGEKPAARTVLRIDREGVAHPVLTGQFYGSGRSAWFGLDSEWRWALSDSGDRARYRSFWAGLVGWLGSGTDPRVIVRSNGMKTTVDQPVELAVLARNREYEPATDADIRFSVTGPDDRTRVLNAVPSADRPGRFTTLFTPRRRGEYQLAVRIEFSDGETMTRTGYFLAVPAGDELADVRCRPDVLRDIARLSGGRYFESPEAVRANNLVLSPALPTTEIRRELLGQWWWLALLLAVLACEWYSRRRIGLR